MIVECAIAGVTVCFVASLRFAKWCLTRKTPEEEADAKEAKREGEKELALLAFKIEGQKQRRAALISELHSRTFYCDCFVTDVREAAQKRVEQIYVELRELEEQLLQKP